MFHLYINIVLAIFVAQSFGMVVFRHLQVKQVKGKYLLFQAYEAFRLLHFPLPICSSFVGTLPTLTDP